MLIGQGVTPEQFKPSTTTPPVTSETIQDILVGVHLAAALEAFSFVQFLGLDLQLFCRFLETAAGASVIAGKLAFHLSDEQPLSFEQVVDKVEICSKLVRQPKRHSLNFLIG